MNVPGVGVLVGDVGRNEGVAVGEEGGGDESCGVTKTVGIMIVSTEPAPAMAEGLAVGRALGEPLGRIVGKDVGSVVGGMVGKALGGLVGEEVGATVGGADERRKVGAFVDAKTM